MRSLPLVVTVALAIATVCDAAHFQGFQRSFATSSLTEQRSQSKTAPDDAKIEEYYRNGFPKAGRSLKQKIKDADEFLQCELPKIGAVGVGATIVYNDQVVLAKGYGTRRFNDTSAKVTKDTMFQLGSTAKSMIAVAIGLLVEDGKLQWTDNVKTHLPWLKLYDQYAQEHVTIGDLLSMNSGIGRSPDLQLFTGAFANERLLVEALEFLPPEFSLRERFAYSNSNYLILGQVVGQVSGTPWYDFIRERVWVPLGMKNTFASANIVPSDLQKTVLSEGHLDCQGTVLGPFAVTDRRADSMPGMFNGFDASGSAVSSAADMAQFIRMLLNKGTVGNVTVFKNPSTVTTMTSGKNVLNGILASAVNRAGYHFIPEGNTIATGYGFDIVGTVMWGRPYYDKGGDMPVHHTATGYSPLDGLGLAFLSNSQGTSRPQFEFLRAYVMGIFLDIPTPILDATLAKWQAGVPPLEAPYPGWPACGFDFWTNPPQLPVDAKTAGALVGTFYAQQAPQFNKPIVIAKTTTDNVFSFQMNQVNGTLIYIGEYGGALNFLPRDSQFGLPTIQATWDADGSGSLTLTMDFAVFYHKK